jgi:hypothetical protein
MTHQQQRLLPPLWNTTVIPFFEVPRTRKAGKESNLWKWDSSGGGKCGDVNPSERREGFTETPTKASAMIYCYVARCTYSPAPNDYFDSLAVQLRSIRSIK